MARPRKSGKREMVERFLEGKPDHEFNLMLAESFGEYASRCFASGRVGNGQGN